MTTLEIVRDSFTRDVLRAVSHEDSIDEIFVSGSVARGTFYDTWSDVDIIVVSGKDMSPKLLEYIARWRLNVMNRLGCKVGIDYVSSIFLDNVARDRQNVSQRIGMGAHFLANFHDDNSDYIDNGLLYRRDNYQHITISSSAFVGMDLQQYMLVSQERVMESWLRSGNTAIDRLTLLRITTKECLYLLQKYLLQQTGTLIADYVALIDYYRSKDDIDIAIIATIYGKRDNFRALQSQAVEGYLSDVLECYRDIFTLLVTKNTQ